MSKFQDYRSKFRVIKSNFEVEISFYYVEISRQLVKIPRYISIEIKVYMALVLFRTTTYHLLL